jgi:hypothetical protein
VWRLAGALAALVLFCAFGLPPILEHAVGWSLAARVAVAAGSLLPLGICLGALLPLGLRSFARTTSRPEELVAWSWAVNCFFSVVSSVLATILAMVLGFTAVMLTALAVYLIGITFLPRIANA